MITRRLFTFGLLAAPAIIRTPGLLMPVKPHFISLNHNGTNWKLLPSGDYVGQMLSVDYADIERKVMTILFETDGGAIIGGKVHL